MSFYLFFSLQWSMNSAVNPCKLILPNAAQGNEASVLVQDVLLFATHLLLPAKKNLNMALMLINCIPTLECMFWF